MTSLTLTPNRPDSTTLRMRRHPLDAIFAPRSVALIGATETAGSVGSVIMRNLSSPLFHGTVYPVNPRRDMVMGVRAYRDVSEISAKIDLAVIAAPANAVPGVMAQCADAGVEGAVIISAGFKECGPEGIDRERQVLEAARRGKIRLVGPNCLGVMNPHIGLNATFAATLARPGNVGFISQSGALCAAILDWSMKENVGFSAFVSVGSMLDVGWGDLIDYFGDDPNTKSIVLYMESIGDARSFLSAAREVAMTKPIIVIKVGQTEAASKAAASHTGALTGSDEVLDAALKRVGALRVNTISELFDMVEVLARQPRPAGPRLTIVTNAGGPGVLATDMLITNGGELTPISDESMRQLNELLPPHWSHNNPIDVLGDSDATRYAKAAEIASKDPNSDGLLVILTPQAMTDPTETAQRLLPLAQETRKPILASWMGGGTVVEAERILSSAGIPSYHYPDAAARAFCSMWKYSSNLNALYETPAMAAEPMSSQRAHAEQVIRSARAAGRTILDEYASKQVLAAYGIPTVATQLAFSEDEAVSLAVQIGFPVVLKLFSETVTHKSDVGGVKLDLRDTYAVRRAYHAIERGVTERMGHEHFQGVTVQPMIERDGYEVILGSSVDPQFGPVILFGTGGQLVEVFNDRALGLPPLNSTLARRMMEQTRIYKALLGVRGRKPVDLEQLAQCIVSFAHLVVEQAWIKEIDINPLLVSDTGLIALDARVVLHAADVKEEDLPHLAIRPYPLQYIAPFAMTDGTDALIRPIRPDDEPRMADFHRTLSDQTVHQRYFGTLRLEERISHQRLRRICFNDFDREIALIVEHAGRILAVGRLSKTPAAREAAFAIVVGTPWQGKGLGSELLRRLVQIGRDEKLERITARMLPDNREMMAICRKVGFKISDAPEGECIAEIVL
jgi:acetyltransferase